MDLNKALQKGVDISYGPIREIQLPDEVIFSGWLDRGLALVNGRGLKYCDKYAVFSAEKGMLTGLDYTKIEKSPSGLIVLHHRKGKSLMSPDGSMIVGPEFDDAKELGEGLVAKKNGKVWAIFRLSDGAQITGFAYSEISEVSDGTLAVTSKNGTQIINTEGMPVLRGFFEYAEPFKNGFARVGTRKEVSYVDREGRTLFSGAGRGSRAFANGYAVILDRKGKEGAIDLSGRVVIQPKYSFLHDAEYDRFVVSNTGAYQADGKTFSGRNYGLITPDGREILPMKYSSVQATENGRFRYGNMAVWQKNEGNRVCTYGVLVFGLIDPDGREILPMKFVSVGQPSEGLCAYKTFENNVLRMGYMTEDGRSVFEIGSLNYDKIFDFDRFVLREELSSQLRPFRDGKASVAVKSTTREIGMFKKSLEPCLEPTGWYEVDRNGARAESAAGVSISTEALLQGNMLPFARSYQGYKANSFVNKALLDAALEVNPFDDLRELSFAFGFAIVTGDGRTLVGHDDGLPAQPFQYAYLDKTSHERYIRLTKLADNVWLAFTKDGEKLLFSEFESPTRFSEGLAPFQQLVNKKFLYGFMDWRGQVVIPPRYTTAKGFTDGYAFVQEEKKSYILHRETIVTERD